MRTIATQKPGIVGIMSFYFKRSVMSLKAIFTASFKQTILTFLSLQGLKWRSGPNPNRSSLLKHS